MGSVAGAGTAIGCDADGNGVGLLTPTSDREESDGIAVRAMSGLRPARFLGQGIVSAGIGGFEAGRFFATY